MKDLNCDLCAKAKDGQPIPELCYHTKGVREEGYCRDFKPLNGNNSTNGDMMAAAYKFQLEKQLKEKQS